MEVPSSNEPVLVTLDRTLVRYEFVSVHKFVGLSGASLDKGIQINTGDADKKAWLTKDPTPFTTHIDRRLASSEMLLRGFVGLTVPNDILDWISKRGAEFSSERREKHGESACFLVLLASGQVETHPTKSCRDLGAAMLALDAVDTDEIKNGCREFVTTLLAATTLSIDSTSLDIVRVTEGVAFTLPDGRPLYASKFSVGRANLQVARPPAADAGEKISALVGQLTAQPTGIALARLMVDALRTGDDRLAGFIIAYAALEMAINKYYSRVQMEKLPELVPQEFVSAATKVHERVKDRESGKYTFKERTQAVLLVLGIGAWEEMAESVEQISTKYRHPLYHKGSFEEAALPVETTVSLVRRILLAGLARFGD